jgi:hypothetical protein
MDLNEESAATIFYREDVYSSVLRNIVKFINIYTAAYQQKAAFFLVTAFRTPDVTIVNKYVRVHIMATLLLQYTDFFLICGVLEVK